MSRLNRLLLPTQGGTLQAAHWLIRLLVVPVLLLLMVLSVFEYRQRMEDVRRDLLHRADGRARELDTLARPAVQHVHDLVRLLQLQWNDPPDAGPTLLQALRPIEHGGVLDGWSLDEAPQAFRDLRGQVWWAPLDRRPPEPVWLRRAQAFVELARVAQERTPGFEAAWFAAGQENASFGYPWISTPQMLATMGRPSLRALEPTRVAGVQRAYTRREAGEIHQPLWVEPAVGQLDGEVVHSYAQQVWQGPVYLGEVAVDVRLGSMQRLASAWQTEGSRVWVSSRGGYVLADSNEAVQPPASSGAGDQPVRVPLASRLPEGVGEAALNDLMKRVSADGQPALQDVAGWMLLGALRPGSPWVYLEATPLQNLHAQVLPTLLPYVLLVLALLAVVVSGQWLVNRWFVAPALAVLDYMRGLALHGHVPAPELGPRWRGWLRAVTEVFDEQRELQRRERAHEAFKSAMVDNAPTAIITLDDKQRVVEFNPAAEQLLGVSREAVMGQGLPAALQPLVAETNSPSVVLDVVAQRHDGSSFPAQLQRFVLPQDEGSYRIAFITDLTARQSAAEQIERQREALRQSEKLSALGSLLAGVAHELNNPLSVVMGRASLLEEKTNDAETRADARLVRQAAERCGRIVRTFLNMARQRPLQRRAVQLADVVHAAVDLLGYLLRSHDVRVELALTENLPQVQADADQLGQVVLNLVVNAHQALVAAQTGRSAAQPLCIRISTGLEPERPGRETRAWLRVADNGPGVPAALRERIFQPFFTTKPDGIGTGLGLSVSLAIVHEHGGSLTLEDTPSGASFRLSLPLQGREAAAPAAPAPQAPSWVSTADGASRRVLVVDDEPELADLMRELLEGVGLEVATAESGAVALELLREARFDVVVCDLRMPDVDGPALWQAVSDLDAGLARRMLFVSGDTLSTVAHHWLQAQGLPSLDKPFSNDDLLVAVRRLMP